MEQQVRIHISVLRYGNARSTQNWGILFVPYCNEPCITCGYFIYSLDSCRIHRRTFRRSEFGPVVKRPAGQPVRFLAAKDEQQYELLSIQKESNHPTTRKNIRIYCAWGSSALYMRLVFTRPRAGNSWDDLWYCRRQHWRCHRQRHNRSNRQEQWYLCPGKN